MGLGVKLMDTSQMAEKSMKSQVYCVFVWLKNDDVTFWQEIKQQKGVETGEHCKSIKSLDVLATVKHVYSS